LRAGLAPTIVVFYILRLDENDLDFCQLRFSPVFARENLSRLAVTAIKQ